MRLRKSRLAQRDIDLIYLRGCDRFGEEAALAYVEGLLSLFELLCLHPEMARERTEVKPPVRIQPYEAHLVVYRVVDSQLRISRVLPARSDWARGQFPTA
ncbi:MAG: type II toxin-antitoxin system RelE/ParE family toxin [Rhizobiales bacterium]|nr:type II toxin-antitoxin system RelE/ParE family toxin [Hyphomicrobiales bacterium]